MVVGTDKTLITLIEHKALCLDLVDYLDEREQGEELPLQRYYDGVRALLGSQSEAREQRRLQQILDPDNLMRAGLLVELSRHRGVLVFQPFVLQLFRHLERNRLKELSSEQLEALRLDLNHSLERLRDCPKEPGNEAFEDVLTLLFERLRNAQGRIQENVASLQGQAEHLAEVVDSRDLLSQAGTQQAKHALVEINRIYSRHVLPTLQFLNEREALREGLPALSAVGEIAALLEQADLPTLGQRVLFSRNSIRSYAKDVESIRKTLARYVRQSHRQRQQYDRIEARYNALRQAVNALADGRLNSKYLDSRDCAFLLPACYGGLKRHRYDARLEWAGRDQRFLMEEHLRVALPRLRAEANANAIVRLPGDTEQRAEQERALLGRKQRIQSLVAACPVEESLSDAHQYLHDYLNAKLPDYGLSDLLDGLGWLRSRPGYTWRPLFKAGKLKHGGLCLDYHVLACEPEVAESDNVIDRQEELV